MAIEKSRLKNSLKTSTRCRPLLKRALLLKMTKLIFALKICSASPLSRTQGTAVVLLLEFQFALIIFITAAGTYTEKKSPENIASKKKIAIAVKCA